MRGGVVARAEARVAPGEADVSDYLDSRCRSLPEARHDLLLERLTWLSRQLRAEVAGEQAVAACCGAIVAERTERLRMLDAEITERQPGLGMVFEEGC